MPGATALAAALLAESVVVADGFASPSRVRDLAACAARRRERGEFRDARVGAGERQQHRGEIRGDRIAWLAEPLFPAETRLLEDFEALRLALNRHGLLGLFDLETHYAWYPPGGGYARHVDQPQGRDHRVATLVLYLNEDWEAGAGGELRLFHAHGGHSDIEPRAGRLVSFLTAGREHAVLDTRRDRLSITGWFRRRL
jgi:SM-20-related protein